jgi:Ca2+-binding RTX toxin-like protein
MNTKSFKEFLSSSGPDKPKTPPRSRAQRRAEVAPRVAAEVLEQRRLFAITAVIDLAGNLVVTGDSTSQDIDVISDGFSVEVYEANTYYDSFLVTEITNELIKVYGGSGNDSIKLWGGTFGTIPFPSEVYGEDGDDSIEGGYYADTIYGGVGYDTIQGWEDNDVIYGGTGSGANSDSVTGYDSLLGGEGNDTIFGEGGGDTIYGGDGADSLYGGDYNDLIIGGEGADNMYGNDGDDSLDAREDNPTADILNGGNGNDCGWWNELQDTDTDMEGNFI